MAWMIVHRDVFWSRPGSKFSFEAKASPDPQERPQDFVDHAVSIGAAQKVPSPTRDGKRALKRKAGAQ